MEQVLPNIDVWYVSGLALCNFDCDYCASGVPEKGGLRSRKNMWLSDDGAERHTRILEWLVRQPYSIGLRLQTIGEPLVSDEFLASAALVTRATNVRFVELVSNSSLLPSRLPKLLGEHGADAAKLSFWLTWHHTQIELERFLDNVSFAKSAGVHVCLNAILFPDNVERIATLREMALARGLDLNVDLGQNFNAAYGETWWVPLVDKEDFEVTMLTRLGMSRRVIAGSLAALVEPAGLRCSAGHDYVYIDPHGGVYSCFAYSRRNAGKKGSALDSSFRLELSSGTSVCDQPIGCHCKEDFLHIESMAPVADRTKSLGYSPVRTPDADVVPDVLFMRLARGPKAAVARALKG